MPDTECNYRRNYSQNSRGENNQMNQIHWICTNTQTTSYKPAKTMTMTRRRQKSGSDFYYHPQTALPFNPVAHQILPRPRRTVNLMILVMVRFVWKLIHTRRLLVRNFAHHCGGYVLLWLLRVWPVQQQPVGLSKQKVKSIAFAEFFESK